jgi:hypothetical protein
MILKLDSLVIMAAIASTVLWIEHGHHINIELPAQSDTSTAPTACPGNDNVPYSAGCLTFLKGATETGMRWRITAPESPVLAIYSRTAVQISPSMSTCPETDSVPYGASCLAFLKGAPQRGAN